MVFESEINLYSPSAIAQKFSAQATLISVVQGKIAALITEEEMTELLNGDKTMYSRVAAAELTLNGISLDVSELQTDYNALSGQYNTLSSNVASYKAEIDEFSASLSSTQVNLSNNYFTKTQTNSLIKSSRDSIELSVSQTYATKVYAENQASAARTGANSDTDEKLENYSTTAQMNSAINMSASNITASVSQTYATKANAVNDVITLYFGTASNTAPEKPTSNITRTTQGYEVWSRYKPALTDTYKYLYTCDQVKFNSGSYAWTNPIKDGAASGLMGRVISAEASIAVNADAITSKVSKTDFTGAKMVSMINQTASSVTINADKIDLSGYVTVSSMNSAINTTKAAAAAEEQLIYITKASGTSSVSAPSSWITLTSGNQNTWTLKRPKYNESYPVVFIAKQRKTVSGNVTCTTPIKDDTVTVIDGGNIITGSVTATKIASGAVTADKIAANAVTAGKISVSNLAAICATLGGVTAETIYSSGNVTFNATNTNGGIYTNKNMFAERNLSCNKDLYVGGEGYVKGDFAVIGAKSRLVDTEAYSSRLLYSYETPSPMFGDVGEGMIAEDGMSYIAVDPVFAGTVTTDQYQVFLQAYGEGAVYVSEKNPGYFIVKGTPGLRFGWEMKARQKDYDQRRLDRYEITVAGAGEGIDYAQEAIEHIISIQEGRAA